jgi:hypothetical protein
MSDSDESVFNFDIDEGDTSWPRPKKTDKNISNDIVTFSIKLTNSQSGHRKP